MQDVTDREWVDSNLDEARAALFAIESKLELYPDGTIGTIKVALRMLIAASQRLPKRKAGEIDVRRERTL